MNTISNLIGGIKSRQAEIAFALAHGKAMDWGMYQRMVGEYSGLQASLDTLNDLLKEDDEDE